MDVAVIETNMAGNGTRALEIARTRGLGTVFCCRDPSEYANLDANPIGIADEVIFVETYDPAKVLQALSPRQMLGAIAFDDFRIQVAAFVNEALGLDAGPTPLAASRVNFKDMFRVAMDGTRDSIRWAAADLDDESSWLSALRKLGTAPYVVKPTDESGSLGVAVLSSRPDAISHLGWLKTELASPNARGYRRSRRVIIEAFISGEEFSVECVYSNEGWTVVGITKKRIWKPEKPIEIGHVFPASEPDEQAREIGEAALRSLYAAGLTRCVAHVEVRVDGSGNCFVHEVNPRPAGDHIAELVSAVSGIDLVEEHVAAWFGLSRRPPDSQPSTRAAAIAYALPLHPGRLVELLPNYVLKTGYSQLAHVPRVVRPEPWSSDDRVGWALSYGASGEAAQIEVDRWVEALSFVYDERTA